VRRGKLKVKDVQGPVFRGKREIRVDLFLIIRIREQGKARWLVARDSMATS